MNRRLSACVLLSICSMAGQLSAQDFAFEYAVKIICGTPDRPALATGMYYTAINVHNPGNEPVRFRQKFATTLPNEEPGPISGFSPAGLKPDQALEIDCRDIARRSQQRGFIKGFAVLQSPRELDVVAVYTAAGSSRQTVVDLETERVPARRIGGRGECAMPDLVVDSIRAVFVSPSSTRVEATIRNIGSVAAAATIARVIDPSTFIPNTTTPQNATANTPALAPGASATVVFTLPYWVFNPDASLEVTADYKNTLPECNEENNSRIFQGVG